MERENEHAGKRRDESPCPCKSGRDYASCCMPFHHGKAKPATAEQLMRSRYSAYFFRRVDYLIDTTHPDTRQPGLRKELVKMVPQVNWANLKVVATAKGGKDDKVGKVEFIASYFVNGEPQELHEVSRFRRYKGEWKYLDGKN
ncbi:MAG: YchJ family metal-binding protein [Verrucomicrobiota bacterium]